jgi:hypothetical protein
MADEYINRTALSAGTASEVAAADSDRGLDVIVNLVNRSPTPTTVRLFVDTSNTPAVADYVEYDTPLLLGYPLVRGPFRLPPTYKLYARDPNGTVSVVATGQKLRAEA